jgi:two-component system, OmpR family, sensor histidine kinase PhoQ
MIPRSLSTRLLASVSVLLVVFFGITIAALDFVFRDLSEQTMRDRLEGQLLALITASEEDDSAGLQPSPEKTEERLKNPGSGLYGEILRSDGYPSWRSNSLTGTGLDFKTNLRSGERLYVQLRRADGAPVRALSRSIDWQFEDGVTRAFVFSVAEDLQPYYASLARFRGRLFGWFGILMILLIGSFAVLLRRVLAPLRRVEREIGEIEIGNRTELGSGYPRELLGITTNLNALLRSERERLARYRNTLGNLAHSFKTPLAVMRNLLGSTHGRSLPLASQLDEQVSRMDDIVKYQLKRAAASGGTGLGNAPVDVRENLEALRSALLKVYVERGIQCDLQVDEGCLFFGDREDLTEIAGNLLDNAFKWARGKISFKAERVSSASARRDGLKLTIEDDGPGVPADQRDHVLARGARLDERVSGQGIGLSVVRELVALNGGSVTIEDSTLGGARVQVVLPPL